MKYIVLLFIVVLVFCAKPWEMSFAGGIFSGVNDSTLIPSSLKKAKAPQLLAINQVISNSDSDLPITEKFDNIIAKFLTEQGLTGASLALMKDDKLIYSKGYGYADKEANIPMDVKHIFRVASVSKLITAVGIMKLVEEGKLRLEDHVFGATGILNDSLFLNIKDPRTKQITVEHLLRHRGGYTNGSGDPMFCPLEIAQKMNVPPPADLNAIIKFVLSRSLRFTPGAATCYSNIGYGILSRVIEKVTGQNYEAYIQNNILRPAGCSDMHLGHNLYVNKFPNEVKYYESIDAELIPACDGSKQMVYKSNGGNNIEALSGAGGWVASPAELVRLLATIDQDSVIADILKPESIAKMIHCEEGSLPIGWIDTKENGDWMRTGTLAGTSVLMKKQKDGYSWVFVTNTSNWKGSKFPRYINTMMNRALATVEEWPGRDLFELQHPGNNKLMANK